MTYAKAEDTPQRVGLDNPCLLLRSRALLHRRDNGQAGVARLQGEKPSACVHQPFIGHGGHWADIFQPIEEGNGHGGRLCVIGRRIVQLAPA